MVPTSTTRWAYFESSKFNMQDVKQESMKLLLLSSLMALSLLLTLALARSWEDAGLLEIRCLRKTGSTHMTKFPVTPHVTGDFWKSERAALREALFIGEFIADHSHPDLSISFDLSVQIPAFVKRRSLSWGNNLIESNVSIQLSLIDFGSTACLPLDRRNLGLVHLVEIEEK